MKSIRIQNLRSLTDTGFIDLKPITLLLGQNSSGKSTFLRSIPLLRQSIESRTTGPILWFGRFVDFGSFQEAIWKGASESEISLHFRFNTSSNAPTRGVFNSYYLDELFPDTNQRVGDIELGLFITADQRQETSWASGCSIIFANEHKIDIRYAKDGIVTKFEVNGREFIEPTTRLRSAITRSGLIPTLIDRISDTAERNKNFIYHPRNGIFFDVLFEYIKNLVHKNTHDDTVISLAKSLGIDTSVEMLKNMQSTSRSTKTWEEITTVWDIFNPSFCHIRDIVIANSVPSLLSRCDDYLSLFATNNRYMAPVRATAERYYRLQDLAVDEVDFQGQNLPMFLRNLSPSELRNFSEWTDRNFGFSADVTSSGGHISLKLRERGSNTFFNLADKGFGFSQILPILMQIWVISYQKSRRSRSSQTSKNVPVVFTIEQPELHLHPYLQAQLIDAFITSIRAADEIGVDLRLLLETHSETIVNRLGSRISSNAISNSQVNVVLFEKKGADEPTIVRNSSYDSDGYLLNWPFGFFEPDGI